MQGILKIITMIAIVGIVIVSIFFVLDIATSADVKEILQKVLLVLGSVVLGGVSISFLTKK